MKRRLVISALTLVILMAGCAIEPPLYLRKAVATKVQIQTKVDVNVMWQVNWNAVWQFNWDIAALGPLGYRLPSSMRVHVYSQDENGVPVNRTVHNFVGETADFNVFAGYYNFLFHNNDSESILFRSDGDLDDIHAYSREISKGLKTSLPVFSPQQKAAGMGTKADEGEESDEPVCLQPEDLFSIYVTDYYVSDNMDDYVYEDGRYVLKIEQELTPATFIYLFQVKLLNNDGRVTGSPGGAALTGMAESVNLFTRVTSEKTVSVPMNMYMDKSQDMLGARVMTYGIPSHENGHFLVINVGYINGGYKNIRVDVTKEVRALPQGGVITIELDVEDFPPEGGSPGGGFSALVGDWNEETGSTTIKY